MSKIRKTFFQFVEYLKMFLSDIIAVLKDDYFLSCKEMIDRSFKKHSVKHLNTQNRETNTIEQRIVIGSRNIVITK